MKPCRRCGGEKGPGMRRHYCDVCQPIARQEYILRKKQRPERKPCRRCGGPKEDSRHGCWYCETCAVIVTEENKWAPVSVSNDALRDAFLRSGMKKAEVAHALGWYAGLHPTGTLKADTTRVARAVGLNGQRTVHRPTAIKVGTVLGLDPVDLDV